MQPQSPILKTLNVPEVVFAKNQSKYNNLPALKLIDGQVITRWKLSFYERLKVLFIGDIYLTLLTFNQPLQPIRLEVTPPKVEVIEEYNGLHNIKLNSDFEEKLA